MWRVVKGLRLLNVTKYISFKVQFITHPLTKECMIVEHRTQLFFLYLFSRPFSLFSALILFGNPIAYNKKICFDFWIMFPQMGFSLTVLCMFCKRDERSLREIFSIVSECCVYTLVAAVSYPSLLTYFSMAWHSLHGLRLRDHELTDVPRIDTLCSEKFILLLIFDPMRCSLHGRSRHHPSSHSSHLVNLSPLKWIFNPLYEQQCDCEKIKNHFPFNLLSVSAF